MPANTSRSQRSAARVAGLCYLFAPPPAIFAEFYAFGSLVKSSDLAATAHNILNHERLFRLGVASNFFVFVLDVALISALYVVLKPVNPYLALLATLWRVIETTILMATTLADLQTLRVVQHRPPGDLAVFLGAHGAAYNVALALSGLGTAMFAYLWLRARLLPRPLAAWGLFAGAALAICTFSFVVAPALERTISVIFYGAPIFLFELCAGAWLLFKGLPSFWIPAFEENPAA